MVRAKNLLQEKKKVSRRFFIKNRLWTNFTLHSKIRINNYTSKYTHTNYKAKKVVLFTNLRFLSRVNKVGTSTRPQA